VRTKALLLAGIAVLAGLVRPAAPQAFLDKFSAVPGETVTVYFTAPPGAYTISVARSLGFGSQQQILSSGTLPGGVQSSPAGSYAFAPTNASLELTSTLSLEVWVKPTLQNGFHGILSKYSVQNETAYNIYLMPSGQLSFYLSETGVFSTSNRLLTTESIPLNQWTHVVATYDGVFKRIYVDGELDVTQARTGPIFDNDEPVRVGAYGSGGSAVEFFNGAIDAPAIYDRALTPQEARLRYSQRAQDTVGAPVPPGCVARWSFDELDGRHTLPDGSGNGNDLTLVNNATRGITGPAPAADAGLRSPLTAASLQGTNFTERLPNPAVRFAADDSFNPPWTPAFSFAVPLGSRTGLYAVDTPAGSLPLVIKPGPGQSKGRIAVLVNVNTWTAYSSWRGNLYGTHADGTIRYYVGLRQPNPAGRVGLHSPGGSYSHLADSERYLYYWLADNDYAYDLYTDIDLHRDPHLLDDYDVFIIQGHSEYWTHREVDHVEAFLDGGGSVINLSGNTMWTVVTYDDAFTVLEGRKHPHSAGTIPVGERWHGQRPHVFGGTFRCVGRPEHAVLGVGYGVLTSKFGVYAVLEPAHWAFAGTGLGQLETFGQNALNGGGIMGHEVDVVDPLWSPANIEILAIGRNFGATASQLFITDCQTRKTQGVQFGGHMTRSSASSARSVSVTPRDGPSRTRSRGNGETPD